MRGRLRGRLLLARSRLIPSDTNPNLLITSMASSSKVSLKLLVNKKDNNVIFAEAGKEAVDFLCSLLILPVGTVIRLLSERGGMVGCLSNLYQSIETLSEDYIQPNQHKDMILKPMVHNSTEEKPLFLLTNAPTKEKKSQKKYYGCDRSSYHSNQYVTDTAGADCPMCGSNYMNTEVTFVEGTQAEAGPVASGGGATSGGGFVKGVVTYMIMDDLVVAPMSTITGIMLLNKFNVRDVGALEEKHVDLDMDKGLKLLKASFEVKNVLTKVFLQDKINQYSSS